MLILTLNQSMIVIVDTSGEFVVYTFVFKFKLKAVRGGKFLLHLGRVVSGSEIKMTSQIITHLKTVVPFLKRSDMDFVLN